MNNQLLQQVRIIDPVSSTDKIADVLVADGIIQAIEDQITHLPEHTSVKDCRGLILGTGLVDLYSHSGEPGFEERETLKSLSEAAIAGGFTRLGILPDTHPPLDNPSTLALLQQQKNQLSPFPLLHFWGALTVEVKGKQMTEFADLAAAGVIGFTDGQPIENLGLLRRLLEYTQPLGKVLALWPCSLEIASSGVVREGQASIRFGLPGNPAIAETSALATILELVAANRTPVHIMRVSTSRSVEMIRDAKTRGLPVTASTTWMHLLLNTQDLGSYDPNLRIEPPLGNPDDQGALIRGLQDGVLDAIAIDHTPYTYEEKTVAFAEAPPGAIGLELALPLLWQKFVETGVWSALDLWRYLSSQPAQCLQQTPAAIAPHQKAEIILFNPVATWIVNQQNLKSQSYNTPWFGQQLIGRVEQF